MVVNRMYPIVPPPADVAADVNLDVSHHELLELDVAPDVLILPSRLKYFAKVSALCLARLSDVKLTRRRSSTRWWLSTHRTSPRATRRERTAR